VGAFAGKCSPLFKDSEWQGVTMQTFFGVDVVWNVWDPIQGAGKASGMGFWERQGSCEPKETPD